MFILQELLKSISKINCPEMLLMINELEKYILIHYNYIDVEYEC